MPFLALALQWALWSWISPFVWFLFFPAVFFSARIGGLWGGLASTVLSTGMVWFFFMPPQLSWSMDQPSNLSSIGLFLVMGYLFSESQDRLRRARQRTETALAETRAANDRITELYRQTLELDKLKSQFFANVSHELRTPLTLIMSPLARRLAAADLPEADRREDEMMLRNARVLYRQVSDLLDAAKLEAGQMGVDYARVDLGALTRVMTSQFASLAAEKDIDYLVDVPATLQAELDSEKVQRILLNLLSNAFKFTPGGGRVEVRLCEEAGEALIAVMDSGPGVPAGMRAAVFERFRQLDGGSQRKFGGTGLGLAIVKEFAELHGGEASVAETPGGGAWFTVRLPLRAPVGTVVLGVPSRPDPLLAHLAADEPRPVSRSDVSAVGAQECPNAPLVLVVEDNADMNAFIADTLRPFYRVASAGDGREGLDLALALEPDLIICDVMMPRLSGDLMVPELRQHAALADVPVVMLTAKADDELRVRLLEQGVQDYLNKPFSVDELLARVGGLVAGRRRQAEKFFESEARFEATFEQAAVGIGLVAPDGRWLRVNRKLCEILGYGEEELSTQSIWDSSVRDDQPPDLEQLHAMMKGPKQAYFAERRSVRKDGSLVWVAVSVALARKPDGTPDYFIAIVEDIDARKQAEAALKASESALQEAQRLAGVGNWRWDMRDDVHTWSDEIYRIYGRDPALPPAVYPEVSRYFTQESWARLAAAVEKAVAEGVPYACDAEVVRPDGTRRRIVASGDATRDSAGNVLEIHGTVQDITERKLAEEEILRLNADLESRVQQRTAELTAANRELDSFAYAVSHDLRAPLRALSGFSKALAEDCGSQLQGESRNYLKQIELAGHKMGELIDGLLVLSRSTRGELRRDCVDLTGLAERLLAELAQVEPERQVTVEVEAGLHAYGDARMIEVVLRNLLGNAWKYSGKAAAAQIRVYGDECGGAPRCCVADNGAGFDMAHTGRLFQPFQRLHRQDEFPGIGIGLATVQRIVLRHGGTITAQGEPGTGAIFCFSLPGMSGASTRVQEDAAC